MSNSLRYRFIRSRRVARDRKTYRLVGTSGLRVERVTIGSEPGTGSQKQVGGAGSTNYQAGRDINVYNNYSTVEAQLAELPMLRSFGPVGTDTQELSDLVEIVGVDAFLPNVSAIDPYRLGATASLVGDTALYGQADPYVPRTAADVDERLQKAIQAAVGGGPMVLLVGPSKAGKTRTAYEMLNRVLPEALIAVPHPGRLKLLAAHDRWRAGTEPAVAWLDDLNRFITAADPLNTSVLSALAARPGPVIVIATLRSEERERLHGGGELSRDVRMLLEQACEIILRPTNEDPEETAVAQEVYPGVSLEAGLGAELAGAPELLRRYDAFEETDFLRRALVEAAIDWARVGRPDPVAEPVLMELAKKVLSVRWPYAEVEDAAAQDALVAVRTPPAGWGRVAMLQTQLLSQGVRGYRPFDYLVAADDRPPPRRPIPDWFWELAMQEGAPGELFAVGMVALLRGRLDDAAMAWRQVADAGNVGAMFLVGSLEQHRDPERPSAMLAQLEAVAEDGSSDAASYLGVLAEQRGPAGAADALRWFEKAATAGSVDAMVRLGRMYVDQTEPPNLEAAGRWLQKAAYAGNVAAMTNLGYLLFRRCDPPDSVAARQWWERAAEAGDVHAMTNLGALLSNDWEPVDLVAGRSWYEKAANLGDPRAMVYLGLLLNEKWNPPDVPAARGWWEKAATKGRTDAMIDLGVLLIRQEPPDYAAARAWWEKAARLGDRDALKRLGSVPPSHWAAEELPAAHEWYVKAANTGDTRAMVNLAVLLADRLVPPDLAGARDWLGKAAEAGDADAMNRLGSLLTTEWNPPDLPAARKWYTQAANADHVDAMYNLGVLLTDYWRPPDVRRARKWYEKAAAAGHTTAMLNLGVLLTNLCDPPEIATARTWYEKAAAAGDVMAMRNLGWLLATRSEPLDLAGARDWLERAAAAGDLESIPYLANLLAERLEPADLDGACVWLESAADAGEAEAMSYLGYLYLHKYDPPQLATARAWYERAAGTGDPNGMYHLGLFLENFWKPPDLTESRNWFERAARAGHLEAALRLTLPE